MTTYKVKYRTYWVILDAHNEGHAKLRSLDIFQLKYPELPEMDTDELIVEEVTK